jgi:hypothetical protein
MGHEPARDAALVKPRLDEVGSEVRLMITEPNQQERVVGEIPLQPLQELHIILRAHRLAPQILIDRTYTAVA